MALTPAGFRAALAPAFDDTTRFPDSAVQYRLTFALQTMNAPLWGDLLEHGAYLQAAHYLAIQDSDRRTSRLGGTPGMQTGLLTSKSISKTSASYSHDKTTHDGAGHWNRTTYGIEYWQMARIVGLAPMQIGLDDPGPGIVTGVYSGPPGTINGQWP